MTKEEALDVLRELHDKAPLFEKGALEVFFPEFKKNEEDRIRVAITRFLNKNGKYAIEMYGCTIKEATDWLEKQGKCETDCPQNHQDVNHPNGCITMEDFSGGEGFYKLNIEYLNKKQVEEIEEIVRTWNKDADCDLCTSKEHCISIEKQSKQDGWTENDENIYQKYIIEMLGKINAVEYESYSKIVDWIDSLRLRLS